jgi:dihydroorotate dehydrogenase
MYKFFRSLLFRLDPETAHLFTLQLMRIGGREPMYSILRAIYSAPSKPEDAFGLTFKNQVDCRPAITGDAVQSRLSTLGWCIEVGTVTPQPQPGNPRPRVFRLPEEEAVINRMGFPSLGSEFVQKQLNPSLREGLIERFIPRPRKKIQRMIKKGDLILGINLGKNKDTPNEEAVLDYLDC